MLLGHGVAAHAREGNDDVALGFAGKREMCRGVRKQAGWAKEREKRNSIFFLSQVFFKCIFKSIGNNLKFSFKPHNTKRNTIQQQVCTLMLLPYDKF